MAGIFKLPPELRNNIYELSLTREQTLAFRSKINPEEHVYGFSLALLATCREIHYEATSILYGSNKIRVMSSRTPQFVAQIGSSVKHITNLEICFSKYHLHCLGPAMASLGQAKGLKVLKFVSFENDLPTAEDMAKALLPWALAPVDGDPDRAKMRNVVVMVKIGYSEKIVGELGADAGLDKFESEVKSELFARLLEG